jgi:hypothetical protein
MSQRRKIPTSEEIAATLREYMRTFPGTAARRCDSTNANLPVIAPAVLQPHNSCAIPVR